MGSLSPRKDSRFLEPIAVVGYSISFPQNAVNSEALWEIMMNKKNTATEFPPDRLNATSVYHPDPNRRGQIPVKRAHFLKEDLAAFDASFFSISTTDAASMDPQQRQLLEQTYVALENAGLSMEAVSGSKTSVYTGSFSQDWMHLAYKDGEETETTTALGVQACFIANRVSWFFNFKGNSANIDTACSSSLVCLDMGCRDLQSGSHDMSIVAGSNVILSMDSFHTLTNLNMLSLDGQCYSFDHRGHGYGRGEGVGVLVLKRVSDAIRDNDTIRGIIRSSGCNQNGHTSSITLPNPESQLALIEETYAKAGLSMQPTRFFEAHGTGTIVGDPNEAKALGAAFRKSRTNVDPLWVGAIKANIGHLEGASGIAGVIKAMLVLEKGIIPPNANFEMLNPKIDADFLKIAFPLEPMPWPVEGLRRASVNSFGNAGTNSHVVLDDVFHFLQEHGVAAAHLTVKDPPRKATQDMQHNQSNGTIRSHESAQRLPQILIISAHDKSGVERQAQALGTYFAQNLSLLDSRYLDDLAYTLSFRRTSLTWNSFAIVRSEADLPKLDSMISPPTRFLESPGLAFIFTGQGAQWQGMGQELLTFPVFRQSIERAEDSLAKIGCTWSLQEELQRTQNSMMHMPQLSQPICTAVQIALIDLLSYFGIFPASVVGHSSGEIAAAYSIQAITREEALKIAYFRGLLSGELPSLGRNGAMISVGLTSDTATPYIQRVKAQSKSPTDLTIACVNSPSNITLSGDEDQVEILHRILNEEGVFARKLAVEVAYHSPHMLAIANEYRKSIQTTGCDRIPLKTTVTMFSSVTGLPVSANELASPDYWVENMVSPVNFMGAIGALLSKTTRQLRRKLDLSHKTLSRLDMLVEIGPHSTLHVPLQDTINKASTSLKLQYTSILKRGVSAIESSFTGIGSIKCLGYPVNMERLNGLHADCRNQNMSLPLPSYVFDHSNKFWTESRMSTQYRTSSQGKLDLLGKPTMDWNPESPRWRNHLRLSEMPWMEDHVIDGALIYPGAGMVVKVIEAANQVTAKVEGVLGFEFKDVSFLRALRITRDTKGTETQLTIQSVHNFPRPLGSWSKFTLSAYENLTWEECFCGYVRARYERKSNEIDDGKEESAKIESYRSMNSSFVAAPGSAIVPKEFYASFARDGLSLGDSFHRIIHGDYDERHCVRGTLALYEWPQDQHPQSHVIHPTSLDGAFHFAIAGYSQGGRKRMPTVIPAFLKRLYVSKDGLSFPETKEVCGMAWVDSENDRGIECRGGILDRQFNRLLLEFNGFRMSNIANNHQKKSSEERMQHLPYRVVYQPDPDLLEEKRLYAQFQASQTCDDTCLKRLIRILSHKNPDLRVFELDLGDSALTGEILSTLSQSRKDGEILSQSYSLYHFTSFDSLAIQYRKEELSKYPAVRLEQLKPECDFVSQGLEKNFYDVVMAPTMFTAHANALEKVKSILKTSGTLLWLTTDGQRAKIENDLRSDNMQDSVTSSCGVQAATKMTIVRPSLQETGVDGLWKPETSKTIRLVIDSRSDVQAQVASHVKVSLQDLGISAVEIITLKDAASGEGRTNAVFVILLELVTPVLYEISREDYESLQKLLLSAQDIVWINFAGGTDTSRPEFHLVHGLARALRNEYEELEFTIVSLEAHDGLSQGQTQNLIRILFAKHIIHDPAVPDSEFLEIGGTLCIPRIIPDMDLGVDLNTRYSQQQNSIVAVRDAPPLRVDLETPGLLDTLRFVESQWTQDALPPDDIEIEVKAIGLNFRDCLAALGQLPNATFGQECAGIVVRSASTSFEVGDHVIAMGMGQFQTAIRSKATHAFKIPDHLPFATAAAIPVQFGTAKEVIHRVARMHSGESILIHAGAGGTGQALIQVAQSLGAVVFATVGSQRKRDILVKRYNIQESHIFYSRDTSFAQGIQRITNGRGVDVVINCLSGDSLLASWECLAPYGRFVEIGLKDILSDAKLPMMKFGSNTSFHGFDGSLWVRDHLDLAREGLEEIIDQFSRGTLHAPEPLVTYGISDIEKAFRSLQEGTSAGKVVVEISKDALIPATVNTRPSFRMDPEATFVIAGGLGGIGRATARWMADRGAKHLILLSRSGPRTNAGRDLCEELRKQNVRVETPSCDVTNLAQMRDTFAQLAGDMPPIKGVCQMSIVARDCLFKNMDYENWSVAVDCKSVGSWNIHTVLPAGMDFFLILSSISGLSGIRGQANYDAGNTYEDAFARYRVSQGEKCITLDLGAMLDDGILAEDKHLLNRVLTYGTLEGISRQMFHAMLDYYCNPSLRCLTPSESQIAIGIGDENNGSLEGVSISRQALMRHVVKNSSTQSGETGLGSSDQATGHRALFTNASSLEDAAAVAAEAIIEKLAKSLVEMQEKTDIDPNKQLQIYGVDSLLAVELRNWLVKEFKADITVFDIQGASTLGTLSASVAVKNTLRNSEQGTAEI